MRVVVALGGNALLRRGQPLSAENQRANARAACAALAPVALEHELVISHGNGPQVGLLALQGSAYTAVDTYPLDVLGAQTEGMIGYMIEQELGNELPFERHLATLLTMIEVDRERPGLREPDEADRPGLRRRTRPTRLAAREGLDVQARRRQLPPRRALAAAEADLRDRGDQDAARPGRDRDLRGRRRHPDRATPTSPAPAGRRLVGVEAVIDKDLASALLAIELGADALADRHRRRRRLRGLGHARAARDPPRDARRARRARVRRGLDGPEGARRVRVRRADRRLRRDRLDRTTPRRCSAARPARASRSTRPTVAHG